MPHPPAQSFVPMETGPACESTLFSMAPFPSDSDNFNLAVNQVMAGLDPAAPAPTPERQPVPAPAPVAAPTAVTAAAPVAMLTTVPASGAGPAMSRKRGLEYAEDVKRRAREEFKDRRRRELEETGQGDRTKRRKKNDTSMTEKQKYRRRLQKNQDSAAAARHANDVYLDHLKYQVQCYDRDVTAAELKTHRAETERDEYRRLYHMAVDRINTVEQELAFSRDEVARSRAAAAPAPHQHTPQTPPVPTPAAAPAPGAREPVPEPGWESKGEGDGLDFKNTMFEMFSAANYGSTPDFSEFLSGCKPPPAV